MQKIKILDCTLREGEQAQGVYFSLAEKIAIANKLKDFGVDIIEIGNPSISQTDLDDCCEIVKNLQDVELLVHSRANHTDITTASKTKADWIGIWASYNDISLETKFSNKSRQWIKEQVSSSIKLAKDFGFKVRFTIEDASRTSLEHLSELATLAQHAGADTISLADTVGAWHPNQCKDVIETLKTQLNCQLEIHLHNDLGLAQANAIAAVEAGVDIIDTSILGIGERAGICDLTTTAKTLQQFYSCDKYNFKVSQKLADMVARIAHFRVEPHHPLVGKNVFTHTSKYHTKAANNNPKAYETIDPAEFNQQRKIISNDISKTNVQRFSGNLEVSTPFIKGASELLHHRDGVGSRWVFMDNRLDPRSQLYIIERTFDKDYSNTYESHVDSHAHNCDSNFVFMGNNQDGTGLKVSVTFGEGPNQETKIIESPASVYIPKDVYHSYSYISGTGRFLNLVLAPNYNKSIVNQ